MGSDHMVIHIEVQLSPIRDNSIRIPKWKFDKADWDQFNDECSYELAAKEDDIKDDNTENFCSKLTKAILDISEQTIPKTSTKPPKHNPVSWWTDEISSEIKKRQWLFNRASRTKNPLDKANLRAQRAKVQRLIRKAKQNNFQQFVGTINAKTNSRNVWHKIRCIQGRKFGQIPVLRSNMEAVGNQAKADLMARTFASHSSLNNLAFSQKLRQQELKKEMANNSIDLGNNSEDYNQPFTIKELIQAIKAKKNTATGIDQISYMMLKKMPSVGLHLILDLFNQIWSTGHIPESWKEALVIPLHKAGKNPSSPSSYRPISLTSHLCKTMETMVNARLKIYLESNNLLSRYQSGFRSGRSTLDQLVRLESDIKSAFYHKQYLVAVFLDLEKAYDLMWSGELIRKLQKKFNINGNMFRFIETFLTDRKIRVRVGDSISEPHELELGTPQGAVISPTLFNLYINDLQKHIPNKTTTPSQFADDSAMWERNKCLKTAVYRVQDSLRSVKKFLFKKGLKVSWEKTKVVIFTRRDIPKNPPKVSAGSFDLEYSDFATFLGLHWDQKLTWEMHIDYIVGRCKQDMNILRMLAHTSWGSDKATLLRLYQALIRSKMDYGCQVYNSANQTQLQKLDRIQSQALRLVTGAIKNTAINSLEVETGTMPLALRRKEFTMKYWLRSQSQPDLPANELDKSGVGVNSSRTGSNSYRYTAGQLSYKAKLRDLQIASAVPNLISPWLWPPMETSIQLSQYISKKDQSTAMKYVALNYISSEYPSHLHVYTDGSKEPETGHSSAAVYIPAYDIKRSLRLTDYMSVYATELVAIAQAIQLLTTIPDLDTSKEIVIFSDSLSSIQSIRSEKSDSRQDLVYEILQAHNRAYTTGLRITIEWVPSHCGLKGNEQVDHLAKQGLLKDEIDLDCKLGHKDAYSIVRKYTTKKWQKQWDKGSTGRWLHELKPKVQRRMQTYHMTRKIDTKITRLILGRTRLNGDIGTMVETISPMCIFCQVPNTTNHYLNECQQFHEQRTEMLTKAASLGLKDPTIQRILVPPKRKRPLMHALLWEYVETTGQVDNI